ncbi:superoxide dismutase family protein [Prolixibacter sp. NT017]|uniref:superoxide dismutase family protein n=1 Tax=Prolixibacter sp. NT017 TaxID=2652390 RepID=UPI00129945E8|nr:superoxide dismutase family protein [Prolixibacter sp. NT017]
MRKRIFAWNGMLAIILLIVTQSCAPKSGQQNNTGTEKMATPEVTKAVCVLQPTAGNHVTGTVTFTKVDGGVQVVADLKGLAPGKHGFHVHQYGDISAADGTSAGGHFSPENVNHGGPDADVRHVGDLGNIVVAADSTGHYQRIDKMVKLNGPHSVIGRAIIVHSGEDDLTSQPTGAAGSRIAEGVIGIAKP